MRFIRHYPVWMRSEKGRGKLPGSLHYRAQALDGGTAVVAVFGLPEIIINGLLQSFGGGFHRHAFAAAPFCQPQNAIARETF